MLHPAPLRAAPSTRQHAAAAALPPLPHWGEARRWPIGPPGGQLASHPDAAQPAGPADPGANGILDWLETAFCTSITLSSNSSRWRRYVGYWQADRMRLLSWVTFRTRSQRNRAGFGQCVCCGGHATWSLTLPDACFQVPRARWKGPDLNLKLPAAGNKTGT